MYTINSIPPQNQTVKDSAQSSFSLGKNADLKQKQLEIIQRENQALDDYHTWIRYVEDIKTFDEVIDDDESFVWGDCYSSPLHSDMI